MVALRTRPHRLSLLVGAAATLMLVLAALAGTPSPALAHDELIGSDPAAGSTVDQLPAELRLTFSGAIASETGASEVQVTDASGTTLTDDAPTAQDNVLTQPLAGEASGAVTVLWKVVSSDGHPISGEFTFSVTGAAAPAPTESGAPVPTETTTPSETTAPTQTTEPTVPAEDTGADDANPWPWIVLGLLALAVIGAVVYLLASSRRRRRGAVEDSETPALPGSEPPADH